MTSIAATLDPRRVETGKLAAIILVGVGVIYPFIVADLRDLPLIGDFIPGVRSMVYVLVVTMMALGLNVVVGYAGLLDLGYVAFYAAGAYAAGWLASLHFSQVNFHFFTTATDGLQGIHISMWVVLIAAGVFTTIVGILIGLPTLRLRGDYLAIVTLGFGEIIPQFVRNADEDGLGFNLTNGVNGISPIDTLGFGSTIFNSDQYYWTAMVLVLLTIFCCIRLRDSRLGRAWIAIREDETAAAAMGVPLMRTKTWSYAIGAFFGGVAGAFYASFKLGANPSDFFFTFSIFLLCMVILGGIGSIWGVVTAGLILGYLNIEGLANIGAKMQEAGLEFDPTKYQFGIYGVIIVAMMLFRPTGLIPERRHKIEIEEGVHDTPFYDVQTEGALTDRDPRDD
jgi:branched-chain amino acid transport system permease protein